MVSVVDGDSGMYAYSYTYADTEHQWSHQWHREQKEKNLKTISHVIPWSTLSTTTARKKPSINMRNESLEIDTKVSEP